MTDKTTINLKKLAVTTAAALTLLLVAIFASTTSAANRVGANVGYETGECGETIFNASAAGSSVTNMYLVVSANGDTQYKNIPTDGSSATITTGPFTTNPTTVSWNVFGGGERDFDQPLWNGYGTANFSSDIAAYAVSQGGYSWVLDGPETPNPFVNWNEFEVEGCPPPAQEEDKQPSTQATATNNQKDAPVAKKETAEDTSVTPVGGVSAGGGGGNSVSAASVLGLLASAAGFSYGVLQIRRLAGLAE